jgi:hypothetical protein
MKKLLLILAACLFFGVGCDDITPASLLSLSDAAVFFNVTGPKTGPLTPASSWYSMMGGTGYEYAMSVKQTLDSGYIMAGFTTADIPVLQGKTPLNPYTASNDMLIVKLNSKGFVEWYTFLGGTGSDKAYDIQQTKDKGFIIAGSSDFAFTSLQGKTPKYPPQGFMDMLIVKLDKSGMVSWYSFMGSIGSNDAAFSVQETADKGLIIAGFSYGGWQNYVYGKGPLNNWAGGSDCTIVKLTSSGALTWYTYLGSALGDDVATSISQTADEGYIVAGYSTANIPSMDGVLAPFRAHYANSSNDILMVKLYPTGHVQTYSFFGGAGDENANSVLETTDGGIVLAGNATENIASIDAKSPNNLYAGNTDMLIIKLDSPTGATSWYTFLGSAAGYEDANAIHQTAEGGYIIAGYAGAAFTTLQDATQPLNPFAGADLNCLITKLDEDGDVTGFTFLGGPSGGLRASSIRQTTDGGYILAGTSFSDIYELGGMWPLYQNSGGSDFFAAKLNPGGGL